MQAVTTLVLAAAAVAAALLSILARVAGCDDAAAAGAPCVVRVWRRGAAAGKGSRLFESTQSCQQSLLLRDTARLWPMGSIVTTQGDVWHSWDQAALLTV